MSKMTIARILDARDEFVRCNNGKWPDCVEVSQSYADQMARELMLELRWRIPSYGHVHATSRCKLYGMKFKIVSDEKATAQIAIYKRETDVCSQYERWRGYANAANSIFGSFGNAGNSTWWRGL